MNGPQHYREAESLINTARTGEHYDPQAAALVLAEAQVHATLALAAATAVSAPVDGAEEGMPPAAATAWYQVAGVKPLKGGDDR